MEGCLVGMFLHDGGARVQDGFRSLQKKLEPYYLEQGCKVCENLGKRSHSTRALLTGVFVADGFPHTCRIPYSNLLALPFTQTALK